jgi:hypothetical protein
MNLRIGDRDSSSAISPARGGAAIGRSRTAVSEIGSDGRPKGAEEGVIVRLSPDARRILGEPQQAEQRDQPEQKESGAGGGGKPKELSDKDRQVVRQLQTRDTAVHAHEAAHQAAARGLGGAASFSYETGPDGRRYAVGGEVPVQIKAGRTPQETIQNAQMVRAAAMAPADPSAQDMAVASQAAQMEAQARQEMSKTDGDQDSLMVFSALKAERKSAQGTGSAAHAHPDTDCGFCRRAASRYA